NYERPNPAIDFANSPFVVNEHLTPWESSETPRLAGISSFGVGGTNVHIILEESPNQTVQPSETDTDAAPGLINWSAATETAAAAYADKLIAFLEENPEASLQQIAATLNKT